LETANKDKEYHYLIEDRYEPFLNETNYALAFWFHECKCTKGDVNQFFKDKRLKPFHRFASYSNGDALLAKIDRIPWGIHNDKWEVETFRLTIGRGGRRSLQPEIRSTLPIDRQGSGFHAWPSTSCKSLVVRTDSAIYGGEQ